MFVDNECLICAIKYNNSSRAVVMCEDCLTHYCKSCLKRWITSTKEDPRCMNKSCHQILSLDFLYTHCGIAFVKQHVIQNIFINNEVERQMAIIVDDYEPFQKEYKKILQTQHEIKILKAQYRIQRRSHIDMYKAYVKNLGSGNSNYLESAEYIKILPVKHIDEYMGTKEYKKQLDDMQFAIIELEMKIENSGRILTTRFKCVSETCQDGIVSETRPQCLLCETVACTLCRTPINNTSDHYCNPQLVENVKAIKTQCKPCPKCTAPIYKETGCDQMFCTACLTPFLWSTNETVVTGFFHNPHYNDYLNANPNGPRVIFDNTLYPQVAVNTNFPHPNMPLPRPQNTQLPNWVYLRNTAEHIAFIEMHGQNMMDLIREYMHDSLYEIYQEKLRRIIQTTPNFHTERVDYLLKTMNKDQFTRCIVQSHSKFRSAMAKYTLNVESKNAIHKNLSAILYASDAGNDAQYLQNISTYFTHVLPGKIRRERLRNNWGPKIKKLIIDFNIELE